MSALSDSHSHSHRRRKKDKEPDRDRTSPKTKDRDRDRDRSERDKERDRDRDREHRKSTKPRKTRSLASREDVSEPASSSTAANSRKRGVVPEMERRGSLGSANTSRISLPYPTLSKTYAKESIYARDDAATRTATATSGSTTTSTTAPTAVPPPPARTAPSPPRPPPSPPLTATTAADADCSTHLTSQAGPRIASRSSVRDDAALDMTDLTSTTNSQPSTVRAKSPHHRAPRTKTASPARAQTPQHAARTRASTPVQKKKKKEKKTTTTTRAPSEYTIDSDTTSLPPDHTTQVRAASPARSDKSQSSIADSSPRTPTQHSVLPSVVSSIKEAPPMVQVVPDPMARTQSVDTAYSQQPPMTPPPPPPPPPAMMDAPRVDYLLQNGGLAKAIPRSLLAAIDGVPASAYSQYTTPRLSGAQAHDVRTFFKPLQNVLNSYNIVMDTSGSLAVATGYKSVARRLLDRLENVFARNISSETCQCIMCFERPLAEDAAGVNWGEILELVSGRCELPTWPPYDDGPGPGLGASFSLEAPCQRIDVDVPEQYREHYEKQSKKTKVAVQSWLSDQQENVPEDADDETLTFIMLTRLEQPQRPLFYALLWGLEKLPNPRTQKPDTGPPSYLVKAGLALQRLYRLFSPPRHQLVVMYLIRHPAMHNMLATLAAVTKHEWEILVSGRFDGFLWSGMDDLPDPNTTPPRTASRGPQAGQIPSTDGPQRFASPCNPAHRFGTVTPSPTSRPGSTRPGSVRPPGGGAPVQIDEETEIAVLAEIEREIYLGMEAMEDAFEHLHNQAEAVRRRLRERAAALSMVAQQRRGAGVDEVGVRIDTPGVGRDPDEGLTTDDGRSEIGPDDSASNVSHNRRRKAHRARERRTPAPVEEEREGEEEEEEEQRVVRERVRRRG